MMLMANAEPDSLWQKVQWQQCVTKGGAVRVKVTALQVQWPWRGEKFVVPGDAMLSCL